MNIAEATERVARGAALLDEKRPGWAEEIDTKRLSLSSCDRCVLGQLFSDEFETQGGAFTPFGLGLSTLELYDSWRFGFSVETCDESSAVNWKRLKQAWIVAIAERMTPAVEWTHRTPVGAVTS